MSEQDELRRLAGDLRLRIEPAFGPDTAAEGFEGAGPSTGQCAATALVANEVLGGELASALVQKHSHWFNRVWASGKWWDVDLTGDQFGYPAIRVTEADELYRGAKVRDANDVNTETLRRAVKLAERAGMADIAQRLRSWLDPMTTSASK